MNIQQYSFLELLPEGNQKYCNNYVNIDCSVDISTGFSVFSLSCCVCVYVSCEGLVFCSSLYITA